MIEIRPLKAEDIFEVVRSGVKEIGMKAEPEDNLKALAAEREDSGKCVTGLVNGHIVGCGGIDMYWEGAGRVWLLLPPYINDHKKEGYQCIKQGLERILRDETLHRVEGYARVNFPESHTLFRHLGFEIEGRARKYTPDKVDCILYALVR